MKKDKELKRELLKNGYFVTDLSTPQHITNTFDLEVPEELYPVLKEFMTQYQSMKRTAWQRLLELDPKIQTKRDISNTLKPQFIKQFPDFSKIYHNSAFLEAIWLQRSHKESIKYNLVFYDYQIENLEKKLSHPKISKKSKRFFQAKLRKIQKKGENILEQLESGQFKHVFGSKKLFKQMYDNPQDLKLREEWKFKRSNQIYAHGDNSVRSGNLMIRVHRGPDFFSTAARTKPLRDFRKSYPEMDFNGNDFFLMVTLHVKPESLKKLRPSYNKIFLRIKRKGIEEMNWDCIAGDIPYESRLMREIVTRSK